MRSPQPIVDLYANFMRLHVSARFCVSMRVVDSSRISGITDKLREQVVDKS